MSFVVRPSRPDDLEAIYEMAKLAGGGFTNLPPDRGALTARLATSDAAFGKEADEPGPDVYMLVLENTENGQVRGTAQIFSRIGEHWPFYSYRIGTFSKYSRELDRSFRAELLNLVTDLEGSSEVGGLFLHPRERAGGLGMLLARSRYLFIRAHRARFANRVIAELRGVIDEAGGSAFWDALAGKFFGMSFQEADEFNAVHGNQFIADLMPKHPIYTAMLSDGGRAVMGLPHPSGRAAMRMLEAEGFRHDRYIDIFDGGPTLAAQTDLIRTVRDAREAQVGAVGTHRGGAAILAAGQLRAFRAISDTAEALPDGSVAIAEGAAARLGVAEGGTILHVER